MQLIGQKKETNRPEKTLMISIQMFAYNFPHPSYHLKADKFKFSFDHYCIEHHAQEEDATKIYDIHK